MTDWPQAMERERKRITDLAAKVARDGMEVLCGGVIEEVLREGAELDCVAVIVRREDQTRWHVEGIALYGGQCVFHARRLWSFSDLASKVGRMRVKGWNDETGVVTRVHLDDPGDTCHVEITLDGVGRRGYGFSPTASVLLDDFNRFYEEIA